MLKHNIYDFWLFVREYRICAADALLRECSGALLVQPPDEEIQS
jgi:hypothetical protein